MRLTMDMFFRVVILLFFGFAIFFTYEVMRFKKELGVSSKGLEGLNISSGQKVLVEKIIDGDEVSVNINDKKIIVRILGIKAYDPVVNDPVLQNIAKSAFNYLQKSVLNKEVEIIFDQFKIDAKQRLLAYIHSNNLDIGLDMVKKGITLVYNRYPFSRMPAYIIAEDKAISGKKGLWAISISVNRSIQLKKLWEKEKEKEQQSEI